MTATERAIRLSKRATKRSIVLLLNSEGAGLFRVVRQGRVIVSGLGADDFADGQLSAVRWAARHYKVNVVYVVISSHEADPAPTCKRYTRRD